MRWNDINDIAEALDESHPDEDPRQISFSEIQKWVIELLDFDDAPGKSNTRILESIQETWISLRSE